MVLDIGLETPAFERALKEAEQIAHRLADALGGILGRRPSLQLRRSVLKERRISWGKGSKLDSRLIVGAEDLEGDLCALALRLVDAAVAVDDRFHVSELRGTVSVSRRLKARAGLSAEAVRNARINKEPLMLRTIVGVVVGYLVVAVLVFGMLAGAYVVMGSERAFTPAPYEVTGLWVATSLVLEFAAACAGGTAAAGVARRFAGGVGLAILVLVLGLAMAVLTLPAGAGPPAREAGTDYLDAMQNARQPAWLMLANPFVGLVGVLVGARFMRGRPRGSFGTTAASS